MYDGCDFRDLLDRTEAKELTQAAASELLGINVRTFQRWAERYEAEGDDGLVDRRMGRRSPRRAPEEELERMLGLFRDKYADFTVKHFHEQLRKRHDYELGYTVTRLALHGGLGEQGAEAVGASQEASTPAASGHAAASGWVAPCLDRRSACDGPDRHDGRCDERDLLDVPGRGGRHAVDVRGLRRGDQRARPVLRALHRPRQPLLLHPEGRRESVEEGRQTQVGQALSHLGIHHIAAYSPEARGRSERTFRTLQGRLPKELAFAGITTVEAANAWLKAHYIAEHNAAFAITAEQQGTAFLADRHEAWREALCVIEDRTVANDNTIGMERREAAVAAEPAQAPLRQGRGAGSRISRRHRKRIPRTASIGDICRRRTADQPRHA